MFVNDWFSSSAFNGFGRFVRSAKPILFTAVASLFLGLTPVRSFAQKACSPAWSASTVYTGGQTASENGTNYTAAYWTQGNNPATNSGAAGSGEEWIPNGACGTPNPSPSPSPWPSPSPSPSPTPSPAPTPTPSPSPASTHMFAPYVDMGYANDYATVQQSVGLKAITLAFVVGPANTCSGVWGGSNESITAPDSLSDGSTIQAMVSGMQNKGVQVIVSFGGSATPDPAYNCAQVGASASTLQKIYQDAINTYKVTMLDFDIEPIWNSDGSETDVPGDAASIALRNTALKNLQAANPKLVISYTLQVSTGGLDQEGLNLITTAEKAGVKLNTVNIMAMDYGSGGDDNGNLGQAAVDAATATHTNFVNLGYPNIKVGITPMIGQSDSINGYVDYFYPPSTASHTYPTNDVQTVINFVEGAGSSYVSRVGMWSLNRDQSCSATASTCSNIAQSLNAFASAFVALK